MFLCFFETQRSRPKDSPGENAEIIQFYLITDYAEITDFFVCVMGRISLEFLDIQGDATGKKFVFRETYCGKNVMIENTPTNAEAAFEMLLEEISMIEGERQKWLKI